MNKRKTAKFKVAMGQTGLITSILLVALLLGLVPDRTGAIRQGRAALAESVAINISGHVARSTPSQLKSDLDLIVERNSDLLSAAVRREAGRSVAVTGDHEEHWQVMSGEYSTESQVQIPIF